MLSIQLSIFFVNLGFNVTGSNLKSSFGSVEVTEEASHVPGFQHLQFLMVHHVEIPEAYFLLLSMMLGLFPSPLPTTVKVIFSVVLGHDYSQFLVTNFKLCHLLLQLFSNYRTL